MNRMKTELNLGLIWWVQNDKLKIRITWLNGSKENEEFLPRIFFLLPCFDLAFLMAAFRFIYLDEPCF